MAAGSPGGGAGRHAAWFHPHRSAARFGADGAQGGVHGGACFAALRDGFRGAGVIRRPGARIRRRGGRSSGRGEQTLRRLAPAIAVPTGESHQAARQRAFPGGGSFDCRAACAFPERPHLRYRGAVPRLRYHGFPVLPARRARIRFDHRGCTGFDGGCKAARGMPRRLSSLIPSTRKLNCERR